MTTPAPLVATWTVIRTDDRGNQFVVNNHLTEHAARPSPDHDTPAHPVPVAVAPSQPPAGRGDRTNSSSGNTSCPQREARNLRTGAGHGGEYGRATAQNHGRDRRERPAPIHDDLGDVIAFCAHVCRLYRRADLLSDDRLTARFQRTGWTMP